MNSKLNDLKPNKLRHLQTSPLLLKEGAGGGINESRIPTVTILSYWTEGLNLECMHNLNRMLSTRRELRNYPTPAESHLWKYLRAKQIDNWKFRRQHSVDRYVLDDRRTEFLSNQGIRIIRFKNEEVMSDVQLVLYRIRCELSIPPPAPSWEEGRFRL